MFVRLISPISGQNFNTIYLKMNGLLPTFTLYINQNNMENRRSIILAVSLILAVINYSRIVGNENIRTVQFLSIFAIGAISGLLLQQIIARFKEK